MTYIYLISQSDSWNPGLREIAEGISASRNSVASALRQLEQSKMILISTGNRGLRNVYTILSVEEWVFHSNPEIAPANIQQDLDRASGGPLESQYVDPKRATSGSKQSHIQEESKKKPIVIQDGTAQPSVQIPKEGSWETYRAGDRREPNQRASNFIPVEFPDSDAPVILDEDCSKRQKNLFDARQTFDEWSDRIRLRLKKKEAMSTIVGDLFFKFKRQDIDRETANVYRHEAAVLIVPDDRTLKNWWSSDKSGESFEEFKKSKQAYYQLMTQEAFEFEYPPPEDIAWASSQAERAQPMSISRAEYQALRTYADSFPVLDTTKAVEDLRIARERTRQKNLTKY